MWKISNKGKRIRGDKMKKLNYFGTGTYSIYSDISIDIIKRGHDEHIEATLSDSTYSICIPNLLAIKRVRDRLTEIINKNPDYFKYVGE